MNESIVAFKTNITYTARDRERVNAALALLEDWPVPDLFHTLGTASILLNLDLDADAVIAALLLDTPLSTVRQWFGDQVAMLVQGVTRIAALPAKNRTLHEAENIRKMLFAMARDIRVIFIKLAATLSELRNLDHLPEQQRKNCAQACLDIYAPLADRLGIAWIKDELEDLALKQLNRDAYQQIKEIVARKRNAREAFLDATRTMVIKEADKLGLKIEVETRAKHFYSIYQKMRKRNKSADELFDLFGLRILCNSVESCYTLLGLVHRLWKPIEGRFKDYIAMPKSNGYQSLHTTVMTVDADGSLLEIQIRTEEMHHVAENGIASHWLYKKGSTHEIVRPVDISIINKLRKWRQDEGADNLSSTSFLDTIKREFLKDSIYVFTPQGKVIELPDGATAIDFAYSIHSAIGERCVGAKADGSIIPLSQKLRNTQVVEILTSPSAHPHLNWLSFVKTSKARSKIRAWLQQNDSAFLTPPAEAPEQRPMSKMPPPSKTPQKPVQLVAASQQTNQFLRVKVQDEKNMLVHFARCCSPVNGDPIVGYVSRGRGIIIHQRNCSNLANISDFEERKLAVEWEGTTLIRRFRIEARLAPDLFSEIEGAIRKQQGYLLGGRLEKDAEKRLSGVFTLQFESPDDLRKAIKNIRAIPSVLYIQGL
ncbi:MAG: RelA/SpoT family protein [Treponema sp.]|jgi:GTP pyrophosphokinase|nr:RelA/SpoT family protein [Treponema sp.]